MICIFPYPRALPLFFFTAFVCHVYRQAGGLSAISRWLIPRSGRYHRSIEMSIASRRDASIGGYAAERGSRCHPSGMVGSLSAESGGGARSSRNHRLMAGRPPAWPNLAKGKRRCVEQRGRCPGLVYPGLSGHRRMRQSLRLTRMRRGGTSSHPISDSRQRTSLWKFPVKKQKCCGI